MKATKKIVIMSLVAVFLMITIGLFGVNHPIATPSIALGCMILICVITCVIARKIFESIAQKRKGEEEETEETKSETMDYAGRFIVSATVGISICGLIYVFFSVGIGLIIMGIGVTLFFVCIDVIPNQPPHVGLITIWGKRWPYFKEEGYRFLANFFPFYYSVIKIDVEKKNIDLEMIETRTPDMAHLQIPISYTFIPDKGNLIAYIDSGGENGVRDILNDIIRQRVREWAIAHDQGPQTFDEAMKAQDEAIYILTKAIVGTLLKKIPCDEIPTTVLSKYFRKPRRVPFPAEAKRWGKSWKKAEEILNQYSFEQRKEIEEAVKKRDEEIADIKSGNGSKRVKHLGIILLRLNIGDIQIKKGTELEKAAEKMVVEKRQRDAEKIEINNVRKRAESLKGVSRERAFDIVQTERGKIKREIYDFGLGEIVPQLKEIISSLKGGDK